MRILFVCLAIHFVLYPVSAKDSDLGSVLKKGMEYQEKGQCAHAIREFKRVIKSRPQSYQVYNRIGSCFQVLGYPKIAEKYFRKTLEYDPRNSFSLKKLREILKARRELEAVEEPEQELSGGDDEGSSTIRSRFFFVREKRIYTILDNGADLRPYTNVALDQIHISPWDRKGILVVQNIEKSRDGIFYLDVDRGEMDPVYKGKGEISTPILHPGSKKIFFLEKQKEQTALYSIPFEIKKSPQPEAHLQEFQEIETLYYDGVGTRFLFSSRKRIAQQKKIYSWTPGEEAVKLSFGPGDDRNPRVSADGRWLAFIRSDASQQELMVRDLQKFSEFPLTSLHGEEMNYCFARYSSRIYFSSSRKDVEEFTVSFLGWVDPHKRRIHKLQEQNFHYRNLLTGFNDQFLYYLTNYDNNFEVYRIHIESGREQRLTISDEDETQIGLWIW